MQDVAVFCTHISMLTLLSVRSSIYGATAYQEVWPAVREALLGKLACLALYMMYEQRCAAHTFSIVVLVSGVFWSQVAAALGIAGAAGRFQRAAL
jgi:hypothetical protein